MKTLSQIREASGGKEAYMKFFNSLLKKFGVDSPSELTGDKKKKFFNALDKGWEGDDPGDKNETTIYIPDELIEKVRAGKGNIKDVGVDLDATDYDGGERQYIKDVKKKFKVTIKMVRYGAELSGKKQDIVDFMMSDMYGGVDQADIEDMWPDLMEKNVTKSFSITELFGRKKKKLSKGRKPAAQTGNIKPGRGNAKITTDIDAMDDVEKGADKKHGITMRPRGDEYILSGSKADLVSFCTQELGWEKQDFEDMWPDLIENKDDFKDDTDVSDDKGNYSGVDETHEDPESPKKNVDDEEGNYSGVEEAACDICGEDPCVCEKNEEAPPGMEDVVLGLKADGKTDEEAFKIAWSMYNDKKREKTRRGDMEHEAKTLDHIKKEATFGKSYPVMDQGQRTKIIKIAKKNSGNMAKAIKLIDKIRKGLSDNPDVMDILKKANEDVQEAKIKPPKLGDKDEYYRRVDKVDAQFKIGYGKGKRSISDLSRAELKKYFAARDKALGHDIFDSVQEMTTEVEFDWDSYGFSKRKHNQLMKKWKLKVTPTTMKGPGGVDVDHFAKVVGSKENIRGWMKDWNYDYDASEYKDMGLGLRGEAVVYLPWLGEANRFRKGLNKPSQIIMALVMKDIHRNRTTDPKEIDAVVDDIAGVSLTDKEVAQVKLAIRHESVNEGSTIANKLRGPAKEVFNKALAQIKKDGLKRDDEKARNAVIDGIEGARNINDRDMRDIKRAMTYEGVKVDRRTKGFKEAMMRRATAKEKREAKLARAKEAANISSHIDKGNYEYDGDVLEVIKKTSDQIMYGKRKEDAAANSNAEGGVDMAPNARNKKKGKFKVVKRPNY